MINVADASNSLSPEQENALFSMLSNMQFFGMINSDKLTHPAKHNSGITLQFGGHENDVNAQSLKASYPITVNFSPPLNDNKEVQVENALAPIFMTIGRDIVSISDDPKAHFSTDVTFSVFSILFKLVQP